MKRAAAVAGSLIQVEGRRTPGSADGGKCRRAGRLQTGRLVAGMHGTWTKGGFDYGGEGEGGPAAPMARGQDGSTASRRGRGRFGVVDATERQTGRSDADGASRTQLVESEDAGQREDAGEGETYRRDMHLGHSLEGARRPASSSTSSAGFAHEHGSLTVEESRGEETREEEGRERNRKKIRTRRR